MAAPPPYVLVVEDDGDIREILCDVLATAGYAAVGAEHGGVALARLRRGPRPCLILLDLNMPVMDGWTFCDELAKEPALADLPVVVVSAVAHLTHARSACLRAAQRLAKPLDLARLLDVVRAHCGVGALDT